MIQLTKSSIWLACAALSLVVACFGGEESSASSDSSSTSDSGTKSGTNSDSNSTNEGSTSGGSETGTGSDSATTGSSSSTGSSSGGETSTGPTSSTGDTGPTGGGPMFCSEICEVDDDCFINGADQGLNCNNGYCQGESQGSCSEDQECRDLFSGWSAGDACAAQDECAPTQGCMNLNGEGHCVYVPTEFLQCETIKQEEVEVQAIEGGMMIACGNTSALCTEDKYCIDGCKSDADCLAPAYPVCNMQTKLCECGVDSDCDNQPGTSVCDAGICRCGNDSDCAELDNADVCTEGACGCSELSVCSDYTPIFDGTEVACKSFG